MLERQITLQAGEQTYVLSPSLEVLRALGRKWPNYIDALEAIRKINIEIIVDVIAAAASVKSDKAMAIIVEAGIAKAQEATAEVMTALFNPAGEEDDGKPAGNR